MHRLQRWLFSVFLLSGFSGLVCQIVWLRLAYASFGIVTAVMSVLLSGFMLGLGLGSWMAGAIVRRFPWSARGALRAYAAAEIAIGIGALTVPTLFERGANLLLPAGETDSLPYLVYSGAIMLGALAPFCICMGFTFPFVLQAIRAAGGGRQGFSYLYLANVIGAMLGTALAPVALIELLGFRGTLWVAACANWTAALISLWQSMRATDAAAPYSDSETPSAARPPLADGIEPADSATGGGAAAGPAGAFILAVLFTTGLTSMAAEVVWVRAFMPVLLTQVYSFASLLFTYMLATWLGSWWYRRHLAKRRVLSTRMVLSLLALAAFAQLLLADPGLHEHSSWSPSTWVLFSITPYCGLLGYLTPKLIDEYSAGNPTSAGGAYAVNVLGCIVGPLLASYGLLPVLGAYRSGLLLAAPLWCLAGVELWTSRMQPANRHQGQVDRLVNSIGAGLSRMLDREFPGRYRDFAGWCRETRDRMVQRLGRLCHVETLETAAVWGVATVVGLGAATLGKSYEEQLSAQLVGAPPLILRDHTATVLAYDSVQGKRLVVNGMPITILTPTTKLMAHLPLAHLQQPPQSALVICFGMGTTYRSLLRWDIDVTAVELVPSVRDAFSWFHADSGEILSNPRGTIEIDDGRRFLRRTDKQFDVVTIDPPPPIEAAGSSLLYSTEFYELVKSRLTDQGILQTWFPTGERKTFQAVLRSVTESFPYVRGMRGFDGFGYHILASRRPIPVRSAEELAARLPEAVGRDLMEFRLRKSPEEYFSSVVEEEFDPVSKLDDDPATIITDDRPFNEYFLLRQTQAWWNLERTETVRRNGPRTKPRSELTQNSTH